MGRHASAGEPYRRWHPSTRVMIVVGVLVGLLAGGTAWALSGSGGTGVPSPGPPDVAEPTPGELSARAAFGPGESSSTSLPPSPTISPDTTGGTPGPTAAGGRSTSSPVAVGGALTAAYRLGSSGSSGFVVYLDVANPTGSAHDWQVRMRYPPGYDVKVTSVSNATLVSSTGTLVFAGGPLAAGARVTVTFHATKSKAPPISPNSCMINGAPCTGT